jgi:hypothetical protein
LLLLAFSSLTSIQVHTSFDDGAESSVTEISLDSSSATPRRASTDVSEDSADAKVSSSSLEIWLLPVSTVDPVALINSA